MGHRGWGCAGGVGGGAHGGGLGVGWVVVVVEARGCVSIASRTSRDVDLVCTYRMMWSGITDLLTIPAVLIKM